MADLRTKMAKLADEYPELRVHLVPLLKTGSVRVAPIVEYRKGLAYAQKNMVPRFKNPKGDSKIDRMLQEQTVMQRTSLKIVVGRLEKLLKTLSGTKFPKQPSRWMDELQDSAGIIGQTLGILEGLKNAYPGLTDKMSSDRVARENKFDVEIGEIGIVEYRSRASEVKVFYPLSNIGKRGKIVEVGEWSIGESQLDRIAYDDTFMDQVKQKKPRDLAGAAKIWDALETDALMKDPKRWIRKSTGKRKGVDQSLPTPKIHMVKDIKGTDVYVDLNKKPIEFYISSHSKSLEQGHQTYDFEVHPRFKKRLQALASEIMKIRGAGNLGKLLDVNKIPYNHSIRMQSGWD